MEVQGLDRCVVLNSFPSRGPKKHLVDSEFMRRTPRSGGVVRTRQEGPIVVCSIGELWCP